MASGLGETSNLSCSGKRSTLGHPPSHEYSKKKTSMSGMVEGKIAIVTAARNGVGKGIALAMAASGASGVANDISVEAAQAVGGPGLTLSRGRSDPARRGEIGRAAGGA